MPPVVAAIAVALAVSEAMATVILVSGIIMVVAIAYSVYSMMSMKSPSSGNPASSSLNNRTQVVRSAVEPRQYIYGVVMVSGPLIYTLSGGAANSELYLVVALAGHQVEAIGDVYLGDKLSTDASFTYVVPGTPEGGHAEY